MLSYVDSYYLLNAYCVPKVPFKHYIKLKTRTIFFLWLKLT